MVKVHGLDQQRYPGGVFNDFQAIKQVILVGDGADMVEPLLRESYGDKLVDRRKLR